MGPFMNDVGNLEGEWSNFNSGQTSLKFDTTDRSKKLLTRGGGYQKNGKTYMPMSFKDGP